MTSNPPELLDCAVAAAKAAGDHALRNTSRRTEILKNLRHDIKLQLDIECQAKALGAIHERFPQHRLLGEEGEAMAPSAADSEFEWVVDPIDGTVNFFHGIPFWCCSVAVRCDTEVLAGAVYAPAMGELFTATHETASLLNGNTIQVSATPALSDSVVYTGTNRYARGEHPPYVVFQRIGDAAQRARIMGAAALDICYVACGRGDGYFESGIFIWDVAAAGLIVRQAGGQAEILGHSEESRLRFLATNGHVHDELKALVDLGATA